MEFKLKKYLIKKNSLHQEVEGNLPNGHEEKRRSKRHEEKKKGSKAIGQNRLLVSTGCKPYPKSHHQGKT